MRFHIINHSDQCARLHLGVGIKQKQIASLSRRYISIVTSSITQILLAGNQPHLRKMTAYHLWAAIGRGAVNDYNFDCQVRVCLAVSQKGLQTTVEKLSDI